MGDTKLTAAPDPDPDKPADDDPAVAWPVPEPVPDRHGAISRKLFSYSNYKSWAEKMRVTWEEEEDVAGEISRVP